MQYEVPQFIEVEDKIFGPLTFRQFLYLAGGAGISLILYTLLPTWLAIILAIPFIALALGLAFYRVNGRPLIAAIEHAFSYYSGSKLYLWKQNRVVEGQKSTPTAQAAVAELVPKLSESKLKDLAWSLNIKDREKSGTTTRNQSGFEL